MILTERNTQYWEFLWKPRTFSGIDPDDLVDNIVKKPGKYQVIITWVGVLLQTFCKALTVMCISHATGAENQ